LVVDLNGFISQYNTKKQVPTLPDCLFFSGLSNPDKCFFQQFINFRFVDDLKDVIHDLVYFLYALVSIYQRSGERKQDEFRDFFNLVFGSIDNPVINDLQDKKLVFFKLTVKIGQVKVELILDSLRVLVFKISLFFDFFELCLWMVFATVIFLLLSRRQLNPRNQKLFSPHIRHGNAFASISDLTCTAVYDVDSYQLVHAINQRIVNGFWQLVNDQF
jgi:hypothetical protein